mgnify:CR=1 FL=1
MVFYIYLGVAIIIAPEYSFMSTGMQAFKDMMTVSEFSTEFTSNLLMTILFTALGAGFEIYNLSKAVQRVQKINK